MLLGKNQKSHVVYVWIAGGLGNQLFQFAAGYALAREKKAILKLDVSLYRHNQYKHQFRLSQFDLPCEIASDDEIAHWQHLYSLPRKYRERLNFNGALYPPSMFLEKNNSFDENMFKVNLPIYLRGYWQSEKYFSDFESEIRELIVPPSDFKEYAKTVLGAVNNTQMISVHVRRGDYLIGSASHKFRGSCQPDYYRRSIAHMERIFPNATFVVFSDDSVAASEMLSFKSPPVFAPGNTQNPIHDLLLMSSCHHHIIANSTFSWWGAWLNRNPEKIVIGPRRWFSRNYLRKHDLYDIFPPDWLTIDSYD